MARFSGNALVNLNITGYPIQSVSAGLKKLSMGLMYGSCGDPDTASGRIFMLID